MPDYSRTIKHLEELIDNCRTDLDWMAKNPVYSEPNSQQAWIADIQEYESAIDLLRKHSTKEVTDNPNISQK